MKCPEVVEWMHRYVDHDLSQEETDLLFQHLKSCDECAEKFELLQELSSELENLPQVTPSYSLVDAIMPQLEAIDRARQEEGSTVETTISPVITSPAASLMNRRNQRSSATGKRRFYTGALGTVAAAAILGVFIFQYQPKSDDHAEMKLDIQAENSVAVQSQTSGNSSGDQSMASDSAVAQDQAPMNNKMADVTEMSSSDTREAGDANAGSDQTFASSAEATGKAGAGDEKIEPKPKAQAPVVSQKPAATERISSNILKDQGASNASDAVPPEMLSRYTQDMADSKAGNGGSDAGAMGFAAAADVVVHSWTAPNNSYAIELQNGYLVVYKITSEMQRLEVNEVAVDGVMVSGEWSQDSATFNYQVDLDGTITSYSMLPEKAEENSAP